MFHAFDDTGEMGIESDVDISSSRGEENASSDEEGDIPLAQLWQEWQQTSTPVNILPFQRESGPCHALPSNAKALDYFFCLMHFFTQKLQKQTDMQHKKLLRQGIQTLFGMTPQLLKFMHTYPCSS